MRSHPYGRYAGLQGLFRSHLTLEEAEAQVTGLIKKVVRDSVAFMSVTNAIGVWTEDIEVAIRQVVPKDDDIEALGELKISADFVGETAVSSVRYAARAMLHKIMAKQDLWLKPWAVYASSKSKVPCHENVLVEKECFRMTRGKSGFSSSRRRRSDILEFFLQKSFLQEQECLTVPAEQIA